MIFVPRRTEGPLYSDLPAQYRRDRIHHERGACSPGGAFSFTMNYEEARRNAPRKTRLDGRVSLGLPAASLLVIHDATFDA
jgi:hypothetical protein